MLIPENISREIPKKDIPIYVVNQKVDSEADHREKYTNNSDTREYLKGNTQEVHTNKCG